MTTTAMRFFNTAGPIDAEMHYHIPPLARLDVDDLLLLIRQRKYFVLHAPRQTGKTSALLTLRDDLNASGEFRCAYVNVEIGQAAREDVAAAMRAILSALARGARHALDDLFVADIWSSILNDAGPNDALGETLARWAESDARPLVLMIDEIGRTGRRHPAGRTAAIACWLPGAPAPISAERDLMRCARCA